MWSGEDLHIVCIYMQIRCVEMTSEDLIERLKYAVDVLGLSQQELAKATGVHQSQIYRVLAGKARRVSKNLLKISAYLDNLHLCYANNSEIPRVLKDAIQFAWDGTARHADALARVIVSLKNLSCADNQRIGGTHD